MRPSFMLIFDLEFDASEVLWLVDLERQEALDGLAARIPCGRAREEVDRCFGELLDRVCQDDVDDAVEEA